ncbi:testis-specific serine/threonine-protein kinase 4-like [Dendronephthya gigantea]|uniref:testis-specific serine/threonine-protein kinase 4-like n=1 Tax=Dendronephthya gigantea TaxID=151771 RepID=UPI00106B12C4|nr:testis-specific serine/threonine-protein kinase 4-like [Dendronephthya gigantea]
MSSPQSAITLVQKKGALVPQRSERKSTLEANGYTLGKTLGEGAYAKVKLAISTKQNCHVAIKIINKRRASKEYLAKFLPREIQVLQRLKHPYVTKFYEVIETQTKVFLIMEYVEKGDLLEYLNSSEELQEAEIRRLFQQLVLSVGYCHKEKVVHRDIKCENILLDNKGRLKITDFGFATSTYKSKPLETFCGSFAYACPQILRGEKYDGMAADVWSIGVVLYALSCSRLPYGDDELKVFVKNETPKKLMFTKNVTKECRDLIRRMLDPDEKTRITCDQILECDWCKQDMDKVINEMRRPSLATDVPPPVVSSRRRSTRTPNPPTLPEIPPSVGDEKRMSMAEPSQRRMSFKDEVSTIASTMASKSRKKQYQYDESYKSQGQSGRRRSSLVSDVVNAEKCLVNQRRRQSITERKKSLASDVMITSPEQAAINARKQSWTPAHAGHKTSSDYHSVKNNEEEILEMTKRGIEKELGGLKHTTAGVAARMAAEATHIEKKKEKEIEAQASIRKVVSRTKSKEGGKFGKFMKKCAKICKQPSKNK